MKDNNTKSFKQKVHEIIFEADTVTGKLFDVILLAAILLSIIGVMLESVDEIDKKYHELIMAFEWGFTILFTIEYFFRIYAVNRPFKYIFSFMGIVDLLAIIPTYLIFIFPAVHWMSVIRAIRLIRIFRILLVF
jgi:voltage-gated potassium channel